jgi:trans-2-enoyl-CoA reductase
VPGVRAMATPYELLGVARTATPEEIRNAYKEKAMINHPDRGGDAVMWSVLQKAYDTLSDPQKRAAYDSSRVLDGSAEKQYAESFAGQQGSPPRKGMNIVAQMEASREEEAKMGAARGGTMAQSGYNMSHSAGFEAWMRNQKGLGKTSFYTAEDLLRSRHSAMEATDADTTPLPALSTTSVCYDKHGAPAEVLYVDKARALPAQLQHGEVLVHMLASSINDEDLLRVQTSLAVLNDFAPFNRTANKWEEEALPGVVGVEGVGVVLATAQNVPELKDYALEVKDWVIATPDARRAPIGCWSTLCVCDSSRLIKVPAQVMPLQHLACSRSLCSAYRLLEDYGNVKPGDTIIQNAADLPTGQALIQLCKMLKIRSINLVPDDVAFDRTKELLSKLGATMVLKDNPNVVGFLKDLGSEMPRLAIDALGGEAGKRLAIALRPGGTLVVHAMSSGQVPQLSPSLMMYQQLSLHGFNLPQWVADNGVGEYVGMLQAIGELVQADKLKLFTKTLPVASLTQESLLEAVSAHKSATTATQAKFRERTVLQFGDEAAANEMYFELQAAIRSLSASAEPPPVAPLGGGGGGASASPYATSFAAAPTPMRTGASALKASERWADSSALLTELKLTQYISAFEEEEMTSIELLEEIVARGDGEKELMDALKEMGIKKMGHRQAIVGAVVGKL